MARPRASTASWRKKSATALKGLRLDGGPPLVCDHVGPLGPVERRRHRVDLTRVAAPHVESRAPRLIWRGDEYDRCPVMLPRRAADEFRLALGVPRVGIPADDCKRAVIWLAQARRQDEGQAIGDQQVGRVALLCQLQSQAKPVPWAAEDDNGVYSCGPARGGEHEQGQQRRCDDTPAPSHTESAYPAARGRLLGHVHRVTRWAAESISPGD